MARPLRNLGIGVSLGSPLTASSRSGSSLSYEWEFFPQKEEHKIESGARTSMIARIFMDQNVKWFFDVRVTSVTFKETYTFIRNEVPYDPYYGFAGAPALNIERSIIHRMIVPGLHVGYMGHVTKHLYLDGSIGMDLLKAGNNGFFELIPYGRASSMDQLRYGFVKSHFQGSNTCLVFSFGLGYYF